MTLYNKDVIPARHFVQTLVENVDNQKLTDEAFREFIRNTLPIVEGGEKLNPNYQARKVTHVGSVSDFDNE